MNLILLVGHSQVGKDTVGGMIARLKGARTIAFADPLKYVCRYLFGFSEAQVHGPQEAKNGPDRRYPRRRVLHCEVDAVEHEHNSNCFTTEYLTPRMAFQIIGMAARDCYPDIWVEWAIDDADNSPPCPLVVITDGRMPNEARGVKKAGGTVWKIRRPGYDGKIDGGIHDHPSEVLLDTPEMDAMVDLFIDNDGTLEELEQKVVQTLAK